MIVQRRHQHTHWEGVYAEDPRKFGALASEAAQLAAPLFRERGAARILELGCGPGRDTTFFASLGFEVTALDYAIRALGNLDERVKFLNLTDRIQIVQHDLREPLPFAPGSFDACYSHMTLCMEFRDADLRALVAEIRRSVRPGGINVYTVRATTDPDFDGSRTTTDVCEVEGYAIRFFDLSTIEGLLSAGGTVHVRSLAEGAKRLWWVAESF